MASTVKNGNDRLRKGNRPRRVTPTLRRLHAKMRPRLTGLPHLADRATRLGGLPHLSCKQIKMKDYMERRVTSPTWGPPPPEELRKSVTRGHSFIYIHLYFFIKKSRFLNENFIRMYKLTFLYYLVFYGRWSIYGIAILHFAFWNSMASIPCSMFIYKFWFSQSGIIWPRFHAAYFFTAFALWLLFKCLNTLLVLTKRIAASGNEIVEYQAPSS